MRKCKCFNPHWSMCLAQRPQVTSCQILLFSDEEASKALFLNASMEIPIWPSICLSSTPLYGCMHMCNCTSKCTSTLCIACGCPPRYVTNKTELELGSFMPCRCLHQASSLLPLLTAEI